MARADDLAQGDGGLPPTEGLRYYLADDSRVIVRPVRHRAQAQGLPRGRRAGRRATTCAAARERAATRLAGIRADLEAATALEPVTPRSTRKTGCRSATAANTTSGAPAGTPTCGRPPGTFST